MRFSQIHICDADLILAKLIGLYTASRLRRDDFWFTVGPSSLPWVFLPSYPYGYIPFCFSGSTRQRLGVRCFVKFSLDGVAFDFSHLSQDGENQGFRCFWVHPEDWLFLILELLQGFAKFQTRCCHPLRFFVFPVYRKRENSSCFICERWILILLWIYRICNMFSGSPGDCWLIAEAKL